MAKQVLNNGDTKLVYRTKTNENFTELYDQKATLASPALTGVPTAPTASPGTNTTQLATTAFVAASAVTGNATHTGDATGATVLTLATVNGNAGQWGSASESAIFTVNAKGLVTSATSATINIPPGNLTGLGTGVSAALATSTDSAGGFVIRNGALGTPSIGNLSGCSAYPYTALTGIPSSFPATPHNHSATEITSGTLPVARLSMTKAELNAIVTDGDPLYVGDVSGAAVTVRDIDGTPSIAATTLEFTNGTVSDQGSGVARITISGGGGGLAEPLVMPSTAMAALAIDVSKYVNTKSISADSTMTFSNATPTAGTRTEVRITTDSTARTVTIPSSYSYARNALITSVLVPSSATTALSFEYTGSRWEVYGDPVATTGTGSYVLASSPTLVTPLIGTPQSGVLTNCTGLPAASIVGFVSEGNFFSGTVADSTITLVSKARFARTINGIYGLKTSAGTCTVSVRINGTAVTGLGSLSVTSSTQDATATAANAIAIGDIVTLVISSSSSPANLQFTLQSTR
jgi:hypothetical protein